MLLGWQHALMGTHKTFLEALIWVYHLGLWKLNQRPITQTFSLGLKSNYIDIGLSDETIFVAVLDCPSDSSREYLTLSSQSLTCIGIFGFHFWFWPGFCMVKPWHVTNISWLWLRTCKIGEGKQYNNVEWFCKRTTILFTMSTDTSSAL